MNWDAIGAIAELLGAIGVIASLVYLATQIRQSREQMSQNTRALRAGSYQQFDDSLQATVMEGVTVPALDRVVRLGMANFEQLSEEDAFRFNFWMSSLMRRYDGQERPVGGRSARTRRPGSDASRVRPRYARGGDGPLVRGVRRLRTALSGSEGCRRRWRIA